ncbi:hypothetical protein [Lactococcus petauri]|uniref:hypothetical protein n=1 Tax=Lactococcus petauri TaxID=1940789 RepID=UPI001F583B08|nr:hypothetical protein [Lactococcus petauri]
MKKIWRLMLLLSSIFLVILVLIIGAIWFTSYRVNDKVETLDYEGNQYYATAYIYPNLSLSNGKKETTIFGGATYLGSYKGKELSVNGINKLWEIKGFSKKRLIIEMTPNGEGANTTTWVNKNLKNVKQAFEFFNPTYLSYLDDKESVLKHLESNEQKAVIQTVKETISKKPKFTRSYTIKGESLYEIYFNNDVNQSLVLQASLLKVDSGKIYMTFSGGIGRIGYWEVDKNLLELLEEK